MPIPLAEQLRPKSLHDIMGQDHLLNDKGLVQQSIKNGKPLSLLLFGPPGCGKTTLARLYTHAFQAKVVLTSAASHGIAEIKKCIQKSIDHPLLHQQLLIFIDEIHRLNQAQQDLFLPFIEDGTLVLIGATTENPSFAINNALLSRMHVLQLHHLTHSALEQILIRFEQSIQPLPLTLDSRQYLLDLSQGDGRYLLNMLEHIHANPLSNTPLEPSDLQDLLQKRAALYDATGQHHHQLISALHKSVRGSDPDAALYFLSRLLDGGESPQFIARRLIRIASEDVGLADPQALSIALHAWEAYHQLGSPEGDLALAQATIYLALAPKSNAVYTAFLNAQTLAKQTSHIDPPKMILNPSTSLMKQLGHGKGYIYDHDTQLGCSGQNYFPAQISPQQFYHPVERGFEREMKKRLEYFRKQRK